ncbi:ribosomal L28e/Mak16 [Chytriomyces cf. hyalinus JEL632]|nr:ribosomal L28e/Mak16 [Chytriomyces cf. hyalinus JEL632]
MSADLAWLLTRSTSSFLVKRKGNTSIQLSRDAGNLTNIHSFKNSSLNNKAVFVASAGAAGVVISHKKVANSNNPAASIVSKKLVHGGRRAVAKGVAKVTKGYRGDLSKAALSRASRILDTQVQGKKQYVKKVRGKKAIIA